MKFNYNKNLLAIAAIMLIGLFLLGCTKPLEPGSNITNNTTIANPASVYCINHGGSSIIITNTDGSQSGICSFPNGLQCDEWAYYRGECAPTTANANQTTNNTMNQSPSANLSNLKESDFIVIDDSVPNLLTGQKSTAPPEPG
jgi:putative hemolysin